MPCYHPWTTDAGNVVTCGQCRGCRAGKRREWSLRCMHEASMHEDNCFVTLTYDDEHLPPGGSLDGPIYQSDGSRKEKPGAFALFMKRLRKAVAPQRVRYFHVGEYGECTNRPHYHALFFGFDAPDKELLTVRKGFPVYTSELLRETWPYGLHEVGSVTVASAGYVSRYFQKRITGSWAKLKYGDREPEYGTMSRNPGIGASWIDRYRCEVFPADSVVVRGQLVPVPRYYTDRVAVGDPMLIEEMKWCRYKNRRREDQTPERLYAREVCHMAKDSLEGGGEL